MTIHPVQQLEFYGPERCDSLSVEQAVAWCRRLVRGHYENFSVISSLVPRDLRDDFAAVYAFCRWADDLGDEVGDKQRSIELLAWWRRELQQCFAGEPRHPVFVALHPTIQKHDLPIEPFDDLIRAFEQDQRKSRYETWQEVLDYCKLSADPVGRLVLMVCGEERSDELFELSDSICTALQLTNHWQDVQRDVVERDRIYLPRELFLRGDRGERGEENEMNDSSASSVLSAVNFEERLIASAKQGWAVDRTILGESRIVIRECVNRTWPLYERGLPLLQKVSSRSRPLIWLFMAGGTHVLHLIHLWNYETALHRPTLNPLRKLQLVGRAWIGAKAAAWRGKRRTSP